MPFQVSVQHPNNGNSRVQAIEAKIVEGRERLPTRLFENCFPNTLDTTVTFSTKEGRPGHLRDHHGASTTSLRFEPSCARGKSEIDSLATLTCLLEDNGRRFLFSCLVATSEQANCADVFANSSERRMLVHTGFKGPVTTRLLRRRSKGAVTHEK